MILNCAEEFNCSAQDGTAQDCKQHSPVINCHRSAANTYHLHQLTARSAVLPSVAHSKQNLGYFSFIAGRSSRSIVISLSKAGGTITPPVLAYARFCSCFIGSKGPNQKDELYSSPYPSFPHHCLQQNLQTTNHPPHPPSLPLFLRAFGHPLLSEVVLRLARGPNPSRAIGVLPGAAHPAEEVARLLLEDLRLVTRTVRVGRFTRVELSEVRGRGGVVEPVPSLGTGQRGWDAVGDKVGQGGE